MLLQHRRDREEEGGSDCQDHARDRHASTMIDAAAATMTPQQRAGEWWVSGLPRALTGRTTTASATLACRYHGPVPQRRVKRRDELVEGPVHVDGQPETAGLLEHHEPMQAAAHGTRRIDEVVTGQPISAQHRVDGVDGSLTGGDVLWIVRVRHSLGGLVTARVPASVRTPRVGGRTHRVPAGSAGRGGDQLGGKLRRCERGQPLQQRVQAPHVFVEARQRHPEPLREGGKSEPIQPHLIGQARRLSNHDRWREPRPRHYVLPVGQTQSGPD